MIKNVLSLMIYLREIMTHRVEVSLLWLDETDEQWEQTILQSRYSAYPICSESPDHIIGVLKTKDYLRLKKIQGKCHEEAVHAPLFLNQ